MSDCCECSKLYVGNQVESGSDKIKQLKAQMGVVHYSRNETDTGNFQIVSSFWIFGLSFLFYPEK